uniref:Putative secreted protein n=1 Tax=Anopheles darlingi TaxID=43151 RepID=A0A2M4DBC2_ANODA
MNTLRWKLKVVLSIMYATLLESISIRMIQNPYQGVSDRSIQAMPGHPGPDPGQPRSWCARLIQVKDNHNYGNESRLFVTMFSIVCRQGSKNTRGQPLSCYYARCWCCCWCWCHCGNGFCFWCRQKALARGKM